MSGEHPTLREILHRLQRSKRILIVGHLSPDGDCIGGAIGFAELAEKMGVDATIFNHDPLPTGLAELPGAEKIRSGATLPEDFPSAFDLVVCMECPSPDRTGFENLHRLPILNIDHHRANTRYGEINFLDEEAPAVGEMVWRLFNLAPVQPSKEAATALFAALSTDTGDFRYSNATGEAFRAAAEMVEWGAEPTLVAELVHQRRSEGAVRLMGEALRSLHLESGGRLATIEVDPDAFARSGAKPADTDEIVNLPRSIAGVEIVAFLKELEKGAVRISLRSKGKLDIRSVAVEFGGGGHTNAAGCTIEGTMSRAKEQLLPRLRLLLGNAS